MNQEFPIENESVIKRLGRLFARDWGYILGVAGIFALGIWVGREYTAADPQGARELAKDYIKQLAALAAIIKNSPVYVGIFVVLMNNLGAGLTTVLIGVLLGPLFPLLVVFSNGLGIGVIEGFIVSATKLKLSQFYIGLIPHGIFELPAFFITAWVGICFGIIVYGHLWQSIRGRGEGPFFSTMALKLRLYFLTEARYYILLAVSLFFIAAVIEMTISPLLLK